MIVRWPGSRKLLRRYAAGRACDLYGR